MFDDKEKKNIYMPQKMLDELKEDARRFEAFGPREHPIMNHFISQLLIGYYTNYRDHRKALANSIKEQLQDYIKSKYELNMKTYQLLDSFSQEARSYKQKGKMPHISYKPTNDTFDIVSDIEKDSDNAAMSLPQYLRNMFASYLAQPIYEREQIIFSETADILEKACIDQQPLMLMVSTDPTHVYRVVPYMLTHSSEEMFNYLLCQGRREKIKPDKGDAPSPDKPYTFRLCRITKVKEDTTPNLLKPEIEQLLILMNQRTPQYPIDESFETKVLLTEEGVKTFSKIFFGRPEPIKTEDLPNGKKIYTFNHSRNQLYFYFRRFAATEAIVLEPESLANEIKTFHANAWKAYERGEPLEQKH